MGNRKLGQEATDVVTTDDDGDTEPADTDASHDTAEYESPVSARADDGVLADNLDKVRDILFGTQAKTFERQMERLEHRLLKETGQLREELRDRLDGLERYCKDEFFSLLERLKVDDRKHASTHNELAVELERLARALEARTEEFTERVSRTERDIKEQLLQTARRFNDDLKARVQDATSRLEGRIEKETRQLRTDKTDRRSLALLLGEVATRLKEEPGETVP